MNKGFEVIVVERRIDAMTMNSERTVIELEAGWAFMQKGITKLKNLLEGFPEQQFSSEEYMLLYTYPLKCYSGLALLKKLSLFP